MKKPIYILGVNTTYHELSACLVKDGQLIAAGEEERFTRIKHGKEALINNPNVIPYKSINFCLAQANISLHEITHIGLSFCPEDRLKNISIDPYYEKGNWGSKEGEELFYFRHMQVPDILSKYAKYDLKDKIQWISHHVSHAGSAFYVSPFNNAAVLAIDGIGETASTWFGVGSNNKMRVLKTIDYPNSIGFLWEKLSKFLGFSEYDASKVMGLASYGNWEKYYEQFKKIVPISSEGEFKTDNGILKYRLNEYTALENLFTVKKINNPSERTKDHEDIAASLQKRTNDVLINIGKYLSEKTRSENLCIAGGVGLNCVANYELMKTLYFKNIYIQPAANDAGTALGAAYHIWNNQLSGKRSFVMNHAYWGIGFTDKEIEEALKKEKLKYKKVNKIEEKTAALIAEDHIVGWFQGKMEWGPRALGSRSLLVNPRNPQMKEILNLRIKKREPFRPYAPSVLKDHADKWFEIPKKSSSISTDFMEFAFPVKIKKRKLIPAVTHVDGTSRIQTVDKKTNPRYYALISEFNKITGIPMVLNTSFNENEPIVCSPYDAIKTFKRTKMDYLVLGNFLVAR